MYKEPNIYLVAHSHGSLDIYPENTGNAFTNVLKTKVFVALTDILGLRSMQHQQFCRVARDQGWS